ncbi:type I restriction endonuclease [Brevibacterium salitolerans]|uniref:Type I restriction enzyme HsdR N-terminal domain-containing protein n=1 Tax=Brevibacterium salitolerans TaxID=1403566 RepID=A0ABP5HTG8_9MICO
MSNIADQLSNLAQKLERTRDSLSTEEATKTALIMPFIQNVLGFDVFDATEVIPEFVADVGMKKGEKVDFAIVNNDEIAILIECKKVGEALNLENAAQLFRYFTVTSARIAILTNGNQYQLYTDLDAPNKMDSRPFLELQLDDLDSSLFPELEKLRKTNFDLESVLSAAEELKYVSAAKREFAAEAREMSDDIASVILPRIYSGRLTAKVREQLTPLVAKGYLQFISDQVNYRLQTALGGSQGVKGPAPELRQEDSDEEDNGQQPDIITTAEEMQGHLIVQAILSREYDPTRITMRDTKSYCGILLDDNNRKPICRFHFHNTDNLRLELLDENKKGTLIYLNGLPEIYQYSDQLLQAAARYA